VGGFQPPVDVESARSALTWFRTAVLRSPRPRFHQYHSWIMAAAAADDRPAMDEAESALVYHWPDSQATWETVAQFYLPVDPEKGVDALHRILALGPSATAHLGLAFWRQGRGETKEALSELDLAVDTDPQLPHARWLRGKALLAAGRPIDAVDDLARVVDHELLGDHVVPDLAAALTAADDADLSTRTLTRAAPERAAAIRSALTSPTDAR
jgi:tetratricopeptide (TPR) repeat protein